MKRLNDHRPPALDPATAAFGDESDSSGPTISTRAYGRQNYDYRRTKEFSLDSSAGASGRLEREKQKSKDRDRGRSSEKRREERGAPREERGMIEKDEKKAEKIERKQEPAPNPEFKNRIEAIVPGGYRDKYPEYGPDFFFNQSYPKRSRYSNPSAPAMIATDVGFIPTPAGPPPIMPPSTLPNYEYYPYMTYSNPHASYHPRSHHPIELFPPPPPINGYVSHPPVWPPGPRPLFNFIEDVESSLDLLTDSQLKEYAADVSKMIILLRL